MIPRGSRTVVLVVVMLFAATTWVWAHSADSVHLAPTAVLTVNTSRSGHVFALGAVGLSTQAQDLGAGRLTPDDHRLVRLMRLLGPSVLRIGGNTVDFSWWTSSNEPPPSWATTTITPEELETLHLLLRATGWKAILGLDLGHYEPVRAADETRAAHLILGAELLGVEIGNEPNSYSDKNDTVVLRPSTYGVSEYLREADAYREAIGVATPDVAVDGPALSQTRWLTEMGAAAGMFTELTQHYYPTSTCQDGQPGTTLQPPTSAELLSLAVRQQEDETLGALIRAGTIADRPTRIGETGDGTCNGKSPSSAVFASALWALDWALRATSVGVLGLNFQGHLEVCGSDNQSPICTSDQEAGRVDVTAQPEYYGLLAARQLEGGRFVSTSVTAPDPLPNLTTWATAASNGTVRIAIDNLALEGLAQPISIIVPGYRVATEQALLSSSVEAKRITLGAVPLTSAGLWHPKLVSLRRAHTRHHSFRVVVPPASAVIVILHRRPLSH